MVETLLPFGPLWTITGSVRLPQPLGSFRTIWSMFVAVPRAICAHCGNALLVLSQYEPWLASLMLPTAKPPLTLLAEAALPRDRFGPPGALGGGAGATRRTRPTAARAAGSRGRLD